MVTICLKIGTNGRSFARCRRGHELFAEHTWSHEDATTFEKLTYGHSSQLAEFPFSSLAKKWATTLFLPAI